MSLAIFNMFSINNFYFGQAPFAFQSHIMLTVILAVVLFVGISIAFTTHRITSRKSWLRTQKLITSFPNTQDNRRPSIGKTELHILQDVKPYQFPPLKERTSTKMAMGLKRLDIDNWLTLDSNYLPEHSIRCNLLKTKKANVIQCLPGSEDACYEVLEIVSSFMSTRFPQHFTLTHLSHQPAIHNHLTNESFLIGRSCPNPLETAAKLAMEDFNILMKNPATGEYHLQASATLFPAGWKIQERIGYSMARLHGPVPQWKEKVGDHVNRYFDHLSSKTPMERSNLFIQTTTELFQDCPEEIPAGSVVTPRELMVRRERQTFRRLERSGAVLFTVRTYMGPMTALGTVELRAMRSQVRGWEDDVRQYKGGDIWGPPLESWCAEHIVDEPVIEAEVTA